jgi:hypothetical protein
MPKVEKRGPINIQDVDDAQDCPGIYVWYARLTVGKADWHSDFAGGNENGKLSLAKALRAHSEKFSQQQIDVSAVANFSTVWTGLLEEDSAARWGGDASETAAFTSHPELITALNKNHTREVLLNVIAEAFPYFYSPLYVGLAH